MIELNKGGVPVKNVSYWKRQADQLRAENMQIREETASRCITLMDQSETFEEGCEAIRKEYNL